MFIKTGDQYACKRIFQEFEIHLLNDAIYFAIYFIAFVIIHI
jgi:hypothetical protein